MLTSTVIVPADYLDEEGDVCEARYGLPYLRNLMSTQTAYCDDTWRAFNSTLDCFRTSQSSNRVDSFCIARSAFLDHEEDKFEVNCRMRDWSIPELREIPHVTEFPAYSYGSGTKHVFDSYIDIGRQELSQFSKAEAIENCKGTALGATVLVQRTGTDDTWDSLTEILSFQLSMDVLWMAAERSGTAFDLKTVQVVFTDKAVEGPFFHMWTLFNNKIPIRYADWKQTAIASCPHDVIIPLPGGSNPLWDGKSTSLDCHDSALLATFSKRVWKHFSIRVLTDTSRPLIMTIIDCKPSDTTLGSGFQGVDKLIKRTRSRYPKVLTRVVDLCKLSLEDQVKIASSTDIMVGAHGPAMIFGMFMPENGAMVEILPKGLTYYMYRNLAKLKGHRYFSGHTADEILGDWQGDGLKIADSEWMTLIDDAVGSMENRGSLNFDIVHY